MPATAGWTVEKLWNIPDDGQRREIIDGELFVTPSPAWSHQYILGDLAHSIHEYLRRYRIGKVLTAPADVVFGPRTLVQPDILVVPLVDGRSPRDYEEAGQLLVAVEVLSPGTVSRDRGIKRLLYQRENVDGYWIMDGERAITKADMCGVDRPPRMDRFESKARVRRIRGEQAVSSAGLPTHMFRQARKSIPETCRCDGFQMSSGTSGLVCPARYSAKASSASCSSASGR